MISYYAVGAKILWPQKSSRRKSRNDSIRLMSEPTPIQGKPDYYYHQSAVIPYRLDSEKLQILMITSRRKKRWVIPKGIIEPGLSPPLSAAKEALEEAGLKGQVSTNPVGNYQYDKWKGTCKVEVYALQVEQVLDRWQENFRNREWISLDTAISRAAEPELKEILRGLPSFLEKAQPYQ